MNYTFIIYFEYYLSPPILPHVCVVIQSNGASVRLVQDTGDGDGVSILDVKSIQNYNIFYSRKLFVMVITFYLIWG